MTVNADRVFPASPRNAEIVVGFSPEAVSAPFFLRCGALLLDYLLFIAFPVICLVLGRMSGDDGAKLLSSEWNTAGWLIAILFGIVNSIVLPVFSGQSLGKIATGLRIIGINGRPATHRMLALRQTLGYLLTILSLGLGFFLSVFSSKGRALHDYIASTVVIYAKRSVRSK
ncbi:MAG: RDD family protein [Pyrinomonadaceae bacterium]